MVDLQALGRQGEEIFSGKSSSVFLSSHVGGHSFCWTSLSPLLILPFNWAWVKTMSLLFSEGQPEQRPLAFIANLGRSHAQLPATTPSAPLDIPVASNLPLLILCPCFFRPLLVGSGMDIWGISHRLGWTPSILSEGLELSDTGAQSVSRWWLETGYIKLGSKFLPWQTKTPNKPKVWGHRGALSNSPKWSAQS